MTYYEQEIGMFWTMFWVMTFVIVPSAVFTSFCSLILRISVIAVYIPMLFHALHM